MPVKPDRAQLPLAPVAVDGWGDAGRVPVLAGLLMGLVWSFRLSMDSETSLVEAGFRFLEKFLLETPLLAFRSDVTVLTKALGFTKTQGGVLVMHTHSFDR